MTPWPNTANTAFQRLGLTDAEAERVVAVQQVPIFKKNRKLVVHFILDVNCARARRSSVRLPLQGGAYLRGFRMEEEEGERGDGRQEAGAGRRRREAEGRTKYHVEFELAPNQWRGTHGHGCTTKLNRTSRGYKYLIVS